MSPVRVEWSGSMLVATLDRPDRRNAVDVPTLEALLDVQHEAFEEAARVLVLTGAAPAFCAGADLTGVEGASFADLLGRVLRGFAALPCACLAAVDGPALGAGTQLAIACDLRMATASSPFGIPAARLGLVVDHWTVEHLAREVGWSIARAMLLTATTYRAEELVGVGFVHRVGTLDDALAWADEIARLAPLTVAAHKLALDRSAPPPPFDQEVDLARQRAWSSADAEEGRRAFLEKRAPRFTGR